jgi:hypothetical protein
VVCWHSGTLACHAVASGTVDKETQARWGHFLGVGRNVHFCAEVFQVRFNIAFVQVRRMPFGIESTVRYHPILIGFLC